LEFQGIPFLSKPPQTLRYRGRTLVQTFNPDFICDDKVLNYLAATGCKLGLLVNFGHYPRMDTSVCCPGNMNLSIFASEILLSFRVFRGQMDC